MKNVRIFYKKTGRLKFISHLDMTRFMARLIKKSGIPVWYTEGFNQHIYMNFAVPLSLGFDGLYEVMDFRLTDDNYDLNKCLAEMNAVCPPDISFFGIAEPKKASKDIGSAEFILEFEEENQVLADKLTEFFKRDSIICQKTGKKGKVKEIDIIPKIKGFELNSKTLKLCLVAGSEDNLNPTLVMDTFFEQTATQPVYYTVTRTMIFDKNGNKYE